MDINTIVCASWGAAISDDICRGRWVHGTLHFPIPFGHLADMIEAYALAGLSGTQSQCPSPFHVSHKNDLDDTDAVLARRTEVSQRMVSCTALACRLPNVMHATAGELESGRAHPCMFTCTSSD